MILSWPWHFVSVSAAEKQQRRELLDLRGYIAQVSVLAVILVIRVYGSYSIHNAGSVVTERTRRKHQAWWNLPPVPGWTETRQQYAVCLLWLGWLLGLSAWRSGDDYLHLTKALGYVGLSQLPMQVLLSPAAYISPTKSSSPSIISSLTTLPQQYLNPYHRLIGRLVLAPLLLGHAILYAAFFVQSPSPKPAFGSLLAKRVRDADVLCGMGTIAVVVLVAFLVTRPLGSRQRGDLLSRSGSGSVKDRRRWFYVVHVALVGLFCLGAWAHVAQAKAFVLETVGGFAVNLGWAMVCA